MPAIKFKQSFSDKARVSFAHFNANDAAKSAGSNGSKAAVTPAQYKEHQCGSMALGTGPRIHEECPFSSVNHSYAATGEDALNAAISASYKQVFGNIGISSNQRLTSLEAFLRDGRIKVRDFVAGLVKSDLYKQKFFHPVAPMRGVELTVNTVAASATTYASHDKRSDLEVLQINDYVFVLNRSVFVQNDTVNSAVSDPYGYVTLETVAYDTTYRITLDGTSFS